MSHSHRKLSWVPAFAGMSGRGGVCAFGPLVALEEAIRPKAPEGPRMAQECLCASAGAAGATAAAGLAAEAASAAWAALALAFTRSERLATM